MPLQRLQGKLSSHFPVPLHRSQIVSLSQKVLPFPRHTMHGTLAPSGFLPVPEQKTQAIAGSSTSTCPVPSQTKQPDIAESKLKGSFPIPLQYAHLIIFVMDYIVL